MLGARGQQPARSLGTRSARRALSTRDFEAQHGAAAFREQAREWLGLGAAALATATVALGLGLEEGRRQAPAECKASRSRNIHDFYVIVEKPIGAGGFGVVSRPSQRQQFGERAFLAWESESVAGAILTILRPSVVGFFAWPFQVCVGSHRETGETVAIKQLPKKSVRQNKVGLGGRRQEVLSLV